MYFGGADATIGTAVIQVEVPKQEEGGLPFWAIVVISLGAVAIVMIVAIILIKRQNKGRDESEERMIE